MLFIDETGYLPMDIQGANLFFQLIAGRENPSPIGGFGCEYRFLQFQIDVDNQGNKDLIDYSAAKGAIVALTRSLALSLVEQGIRLNAVAPCYVFLTSDDSSCMTGQVLHPNGVTIVGS